MNSPIQWALWAVAMTLIMGWFGRVLRRQSQAYTGEALRHPRAVLVVGVATSLPFVLAAVASAVALSGKDRWMSLAFLGFATLGGYLVYEYRVVQYRLTADGFTYRTPFGGAGSARWADVRAAGYSPAMKWFWLELRDGKVVRLSVMIMGLDRFATALLANAGEAIAAQVRPIFEATAKGNPPSVWQ